MSWMLKVQFVALALGLAAAATSTSTSASAPSQPAAVEEAADLGPTVTTCGGKICAAGTVCCNSSCGICVPKGMECTQQACLGPSGDDEYAE